MTGVLAGFATIGAVIGLGALLAHLRVLDDGARVVLSRLSFFVASPALMVVVVGRADVHSVLSGTLVASAAAVLAPAVVYVAAARRVWHRDLADTVVGTLCSAYVNAGNLGLPIAAYVLGDAALVAPILLMQLLVLQPLALTLLDSATTERRSLLRALTGPLTNPLTLGSLLGLAIAVTGLRLPDAVRDPLDLVGGMAVPSMLLAYGISLRLGPKPGRSTAVAEVAVIGVLKLVVAPVAAYATGRLVLGLDDAALLAVTVLAALPTAQNIFVHATRYGRSEVLARDSIFITTVLSVPVLVVVAALLG